MAVRAIVSHTAKQAAMHGFNKPAVKVGTTICALWFGGSFLLDDTTKTQIANQWTKAQTAIGNIKHISDADLKKGAFQGVVGVEGVVLSSPLFYGVFHLIHPERRNKTSAKTSIPRTPSFISISSRNVLRHLFSSSLKGISGSLAAAPAMFAFYGLATLIIPIIQDKLITDEITPKQAKSLAESVTILGAAPLEFVIEFQGCGGSFNQLQPGASLLGTAAIVGRLVAGVLIQLRAAGSEDKSKKKELEDFLVTLVGTTLSQHLINATMKAQIGKAGLPGVWNYLKVGHISGVGTTGASLARLGGTFFQRLTFVLAWNRYTHTDRPLPKWAGGDKIEMCKIEGCHGACQSKK
ncbi:MAG: hypothetical protein P0S95_02490 [Rhabdochlamydiaceae bacterium]|nr:hypothetical protein [Candidatus Amphrikana amoebophyrae]